jgi:hypothetical protein
LEQQHQQVVASGQEVECRVGADGPEALGRSTGTTTAGPLHGHLDVATGGQSLEMVAGHVRMERETGGHLGGGRPGVGPYEEVDLPAGGVAEGGRDRGHRRRELGVGVGCRDGYLAVRVGLHVP